MKKPKLQASLLIAAALAAVASAQPATMPTRVEADDLATLAASRDREVLLEGVASKVEWSRTGAVMTIEFRGVKRNEFSVVAFQQIRARLDRAFMGDAAKNFTGARLRIRGKVSEYRGNLQIAIGDPSQITVVEPATVATQPS